MEDNKVPPPSKHLPPVDETKADSVEGISRPPVDWHKATTQPTFVVEDSFSFPYSATCSLVYRMGGPDDDDVYPLSHPFYLSTCQP